MQPFSLHMPLDLFLGKPPGTAVENGADPPIEGVYPERARCGL